MFEALFLQQAPTGESLTAIILGAIATLIPTISIILKQWSNGKFTSQQLAEKGLELQGAIASEQTQRRASERLSCIVAQLIIANNDGRIDQREFDHIIGLARAALVETSREAGLDITEIVTAAEKLLAKPGSGQPIDIKSIPYYSPTGTPMLKPEELLQGFDLDAIRQAPAPTQIPGADKMNLPQFQAAFRVWSEAHGFKPMTPVES
ncbi:hypothetical protein Ngar_c03520 [Candidatus Nitrososphaera gargensis Ga9.2]|uniref:Uncharacterized protein n=1 Tax=Nitrososphaera gargensis (strain Ga9.2) TaxID=1237085 RepID=K0ICI4_NITGG|nr:hypothetical protein [Candidatus Nitrososphaera gargensis]AFU57270.1 hypothetical protein Ngar_c03220 [Candidatus Nitrososphaera gargensis Ga9.2]AFU57300.1 hypothetical protein Ngar_c03520 [Candidatus Nitrososphaera gargensis Ga9.2]